MKRTISDFFKGNNSRNEVPPEPTSSTSSAELSEPENKGTTGARKFRDEWKSQFPFLKYDQEKNVMICEICRNAGNRTSEWVTGVSNFKKDAITRHQTSKLHETSLNTKIQQKESVVARSKAIEKSEKTIIQIMRNVYWLAKENVAMMKCTSLHSLTELQIAASNSVESQSTETSLQYRDRTAGWEMVEVLSSVIEDYCWKEINRSPFISLMIDESTDISLSKNLIVYVKFFNQETFEPETKFVKLIEMTEKCDALSIVNSIKTFLNSKEIDLRKIIGFGSDGAAVMLGEKGGVQALLKQEANLLISVHDFGHAENLAVLSAYGSVPFLKKLDTIITSIYSYFNRSSNRQYNLCKIEKELEVPVLKMKKIYQIRWLARSESVLAVVRCLPALFNVFRDDDTDPAANGIYNYITQFKFLLHLFFMCDILQSLGTLSKYLQTKNLHPHSAQVRIQSVVSLYKDSFIDQSIFESQGICQNFTKLMSDMEEQPLTYHGHVIKYTQSDKKDFENNVTIFMKELCSNLETRFGKDKLHNVMMASKIFDPAEYPLTTEKDLLLSFGMEELDCLLTHFSKCESQNISIEDTKEEYLQYRHMVANNFKTKTFNDICSLLQRPSYKQQFPNLATIAVAVSLIPIGSVDCERGFSQQNLIKTKTRNRLLTKHLDCLLRISIEGPAVPFFDFKEAYCRWRRLAQRQS